jgi:tRNA (guanine37-N1)-methyltransferase
MKFTVVTILPELIEPALTAGVVGRAREAGKITVATINPRDFTTDKHRTVDDTPYGGGPGMVMKAEPLLAAIERACARPADDIPDEDVATTMRLDRDALRGAREAATPEAIDPDDIITTRPFARRTLDDQRSAVEGSLSNVDASIDRLESALGGNLDALATVAPTSSAAPTHATAKPHRILLSPSGKPLTQARVRELATHDHLVLVCGRYEGVDQRAIDLAIDEEISIGDYVLSGGELGALVIIDAVSRYVPGVLGEATSVDDESFSAGLLEYPQYTKPAEVRGLPVPPVLQSGNHALINSWRKQQAMQRTVARRIDLWRNYRPTKADAKLLAPLRKRTHVALVHHPVVDRAGTVITTSLTNFDIHDLARSSMTYGLAGYHIVTPITSQREKAEHIAQLWIGDEQGEHRAAALRLVHAVDSIEAVIAALTAEHGQAPLVVATSAKPTSFPAAERRTPSELVAEATLDPSPLLILLGTGWGLADNLIPSVSRVLTPIEGASDWNHLSVRSAGAVLLDRLFGRAA